MTQQPTPLLSSLSFGALLTYSPRGTSHASQVSRAVAYELKSARPHVVETAIRSLLTVIERGELRDFFGKDVVLVPAPRSSPLQPGWLWPAQTICQEMVRQGLGSEVLACIRRTVKVPKSAYAGPGERPTAITHRDSMAIEAQLRLLPTARVTIVDDVVTKGATLLACASLLQVELPKSVVRGFGVIRTRGLQPEIDRIVDPCVGEITWNGADIEREP